MATCGTNTDGLPLRRFYVVKEAAGFLGVSTMTLYRMIREQQFPAVRLRTRWIVPVEAVSERTATAMSPADSLGPGLVDVPVVARYLRVSAATLYRLIQEGGFPAVWLRGRLLVSAALVDELAVVAMAKGAAVDPKDWVGLDRSTTNPGANDHC